jgi:hypothetical protein
MMALHASLARPQKALDLIADIALTYKPRPTTKPRKKRKKRAAKIEKEKMASSPEPS